MDQSQRESGILIQDIHLKINFKTKAREYTDRRKFPWQNNFFKKYLFIYLAAPSLSCGVWDLVPWLGIEAGPPELAGRFLTTAPPGKSPGAFLKKKVY